MICAGELSSVVNAPIDWLWQGRIAYGKVTLIQGNTGIGKTSLVVKLAADLSNGIYLPAVVNGELHEPVQGEPVKTYYVTIENALDDTIAPLFDLFGGNRNYVYYQKEEIGHFVLNEHDISECVRRTGARLIIIDPWQEFLDEETCEYDGSVRQMINRIQMVAAKTGVAILLAGNFVKSGSSDIARQRGSSELANTLRTILTLKPQWATVTDEEIEDFNKGFTPDTDTYKKLTTKWDQFRAGMAKGGSMHWFGDDDDGFIGALNDAADWVGGAVNDLLAGGVNVFKAVLIRETGQYRVSWECETDEGLYNMERDQQPDDRNNGDRAAGDHTA